MISVKVVGVAERNISVNPATPLVLAANKATMLFDNVGNKKEVVNRYVQNVGADPLFIALNEDAGPNNYHKILPQYADLDLSANRATVSGWSLNGTTVAIILSTRDEIVNNTSIATAP